MGKRRRFSPNYSNNAIYELPIALRTLHANAKQASEEDNESIKATELNRKKYLQAHLKNLMLNMVAIGQQILPNADNIILLSRKKKGHKSDSDLNRNLTSAVIQYSDFSGVCSFLVGICMIGFATLNNNTLGLKSIIPKEFQPSFENISLPTAPVVPPSSSQQSAEKSQKPEKTKKDVVEEEDKSVNVSLKRLRRINGSFSVKMKKPSSAKKQWVSMISQIKSATNYKLICQDRYPISSLPIALKKKADVFGSVFDFSHTQHVCNSQKLGFMYRLLVRPGLITCVLSGSRFVERDTDPVPIAKAETSKSSTRDKKKHDEAATEAKKQTISLEQ
ncbi:hypothetical protein [Parasitella parasitica]|uniref:Uncharacterized protein n=1 Tax=Parasitella parasitica TaxID=35722 RepID=A0A0B7NBV7_9FUNG|nr:hypothetical protein [Parasitella parasitica]